MNEGLRAFGARLGELFAEKGISVDEISKATKIRIVFIEALLRGKREDLPDDVFVIGFLRAVLGYLHVNPEPWVNEYKSLSRPAEEPEPDPACDRFTPVPQIRTRSHFMLWTVLVLAIVGCSGMYLFRMSPRDLRDLLVQKRPEEGKGTAQKLRTASPATIPSVDRVPSVNEASAPPSGDENKQPEAGAPDPETHPIFEGGRSKTGLEIVAMSKCWIEVRSEGDGDQVVVKRELPAGETIACPGIVTYRVTLGDSSAVNVFFNGKEVVFDKSKGKVVRDMLVGEEKK